MARILHFYFNLLEYLLLIKSSYGR